MSVDAAEAIRYLAFIAGWGGGTFPVYLDGKPTPATHIKDGARLAQRAAAWDFEDSAQVEVGLPVPKPGWVQDETTVLWAWAESRDQVRRATRFRPVPSLVLRMGGSCRRLLVWALDEQAPYTLVESGNKKIAYRLRAPQKYARPEQLRIPLPGTFLRVGRSRPAPVLVTRMETDAFHRSQVVATLKAPPLSWVERQRQSGAWR